MKTINHIAMVVDRSGSTQGIAPEIIRQFNEQASFINSQSKENNQETFLSLYTFSTHVDKPLLFEVPLDLVELRPLTKDAYKINGMTALRDCVGQAVEDLSYLNKNSDTDGNNHSYLIITFTDGEENESKKYSQAKLFNLMKEKSATDMWSFVFSVPQGSKRLLINDLGIPEGNIQEWDTTSERGVKTASANTVVGLKGYFTARKAGKKSVKGFYTTDLTRVSVSKVQKQLVEVTTEFDKFPVSSFGPLVIKDFCETHAGSFTQGNAFYELTKTETIQPQKLIVVENLSSGKLYSGDSARQVLNLPEVNGNIRVHPGNHKNFRIFVQSTSVNRKLIPNTTLLVKKANVGYFAQAASPKAKKVKK